MSASLGLPMATDCTGYELVLRFSDSRLSLARVTDSLPAEEIYAEFVSGKAGYRRKHGGKELLRRAIGFHKNRALTVLDTTGGLGRDSFLMAGYGCRVRVLERNGIVAALLEDGLQRALKHPETADIAARIQLSVQDSLSFLGRQDRASKRYDVIYLDPMYPVRNKSASVKKEMRILQKLIGHEEDAEQLLTAALAVAGKRIVVKRPKNALPLKGMAPSHSLSGKTTRYDVYMIPGGD